MGAVLSVFMRKKQTINNKNATVTGQVNIEGCINTVQSNINNYYLVAKNEPELTDFNFPKLIDSFKGRVDEFKRLDDYLFLYEKKMVVIWGLPGFGKSEFLKWFAQLCKLIKKIKYICWIQASNSGALKHSLMNLVKTLNLSEVDDLRLLLQTVSRRYHNSETLFVFDDADSPRNLLDWETPNKCWTLVSSKSGEWNTMPSIELGPLELDAAVAVLQHQQDPFVTSNPNTLRALAELLDNVPLALQLAAAYIRQETDLFSKKFDIHEYIKRLRKSRRKLLNEPVPSFLPYEYCIQEAMNLSLEKIRKSTKFESSLALDILNILAYLDRYQIPEKLLLEFSFIQNKLKKEEDEDEEREPEKKVRRAFNVLQRYSFVHLEDGYVRIHGLVQDTILFHHSQPNANIEEHYVSCLEYVLNKNFVWHSISILEQADKRLEIFKMFYSKYKSTIISENINKFRYDWLMPLFVSYEKFQNKTMTEKNYFINNFSNRSFLEQLVIIGNEKCLDHIISELGLQAKRVIIDHQLIYSAINSQESNMIKLLLKYEEDIINFSVLRYAFSVSNFDILNLILKRCKINVNDQDDNGDTFISFTLFNSIAQYDTSDIIWYKMRALVEHGASVDNVNNQGWSLLHVAVHFIDTAIHLKVVELIVNELNVDVNKQNNKGMTALHIILYRRLLKDMDDELMSNIVDELTRRDAKTRKCVDVNVKDNDGLSPLDIIMKNKFNFLLPILATSGIGPGRRKTAD